MRKLSRYLPYKYTFILRVNLPNGKTGRWEADCNVIAGKQKVTLLLKKEDVNRSIAMGGVGSTQACSMALCVTRQEGEFPHSVIGYVDWTYSRAYVVSKVDKQGKPIECYVYEHSDDIALLNDTANGQKKLLEMLEESGDRPVVLNPLRQRSYKEKSKKTIGHSEAIGNNKRSKKRRRTPCLKGHKLREAVANLGGIDK